MFVALVPPEAAVAHLDEFLEPRRSAGSLRWSPAEQVHVTLAFSPHVPERVLDEMGERLERAAAKRTRFETRITGGGAFPDAARARVLWAGLALTEQARTEISRLATGARAAMAKAGAEVSGQRFRPHLTVARTRQQAEITDWVRLLDAYSGPAWTAEEISLVASYLGEGPRRRPRHEILATYLLRAAS